MAAKRTQPLPDGQIQLIARALADPRRYEILQKLSARNRPTPCTDILECIGVTAATLSHHMKELETAGLVRCEKKGKFVNYFPQPRILRAYLDRLKSDLS
ncbi:MAG TPA: metalloregulator ArsR/SmtB family transcription factor [Candidatus Acidoferrum sp.]|jgi:ArsR family transcriptional regulator|nr:metalloregulator ArsR/SmtB family transcription factor [Candidatus Acidoferrum sp.]